MGQRFTVKKTVGLQPVRARRWRSLGCAVCPAAAVVGVICDQTVCCMKQTISHGSLLLLKTRAGVMFQLFGAILLNVPVQGNAWASVHMFRLRS